MTNQLESLIQYNSYIELEDISPTLPYESDIKLVNMTYTVKGWNPSISGSAGGRFRTDEEISDSIYKMMETKKS